MPSTHSTEEPIICCPSQLIDEDQNGFVLIGGVSKSDTVPVLGLGCKTEMIFVLWCLPLELSAHIDRKLGEQVEVD